jgi:hypothetical protein
MSEKFDPEESLAEQEKLMSELGPHGFDRQQIAAGDTIYETRRRLTDLRLHFSHWLSSEGREVEIDWKATPNASRYFGR